jgi:hypothetical protein
MLEVIRRTLNIAMDDHYMILDYLRAEGRIKVRKRPPPKKKRTKEALAEVPKECLPDIEEKPRYIHSWEYKSTITREAPDHPTRDGAPAAPRTRPDRKGKKPPKVGEPMAAPPKPKAESKLDDLIENIKSTEPAPGPPEVPEKAEPPEKKEERPKSKKKKRPTKVKCTKCGETIPVPPSDGPVKITCPGCGVSGRI